MQRGAARAERAVEPELDRAHRQVAVADRLGPPALAILAPRLLAAEGREHPERKPVAADQARVRGDRGQVEPGLVGPGEALGQALRHHRLDRGVEALGGGRRHEGADQVLGQAARRIGGAARDRGTLERGPAGPRGVAVDPHQRDRMAGRGPVQRGARREPLARPARLVPAAPRDPLPRTEPRRRRGHHPGDLVLGAGRGQFQLEPRAGQQHEMAVPVDQARQHGAAAKVDRVLAGSRVDVGAPTREHDSPIADDQRVHHRAGGIQRVDPPVGQEHGTRWRSRPASSGTARRSPAPRSPGSRS